jgi:serine phosphatase RsbU (regulator of sigma subunit)
MGHDLQAALLADMAIGGFRHGRRQRHDPAATLHYIDSLIAARFPAGHFVTGQLLVLDTEAGEASIWTAGHPPPVLLPQKGEAEAIEVQPGVPLGLGPSTYAPTKVSLAPGDAVLLLSDGVYEARSPAGDFFGWDRVTTRIHRSLQSGMRAAEALRLLIREVIEFQGDDVRDDATLVIVRWEPEAAGAPAAPSASRARRS